MEAVVTFLYILIGIYNVKYLPSVVECKIQPLLLPLFPHLDTPLFISDSDECLP